MCPLRAPILQPPTHGGFPIQPGRSQHRARDTHPPAWWHTRATRTPRAVWDGIAILAGPVPQPEILVLLGRAGTQHLSPYVLPSSQETSAQTACPCPHPHPHHEYPKNSLLKASAEHSQGHIGFATGCSHCRRKWWSGRASREMPADRVPVCRQGTGSTQVLPGCPQTALPVAEQQQSSPRTRSARTSCSPWHRGTGVTGCHRVPGR